LLTYEKVGERQERLIKTIAAAMGANVEGESKGEVSPGGIHLDQEKLVSKDKTDENSNVGYSDGDIKLGSTTAFGYVQVDKID